MQHTDITADQAFTLGVLVNTDRIRSSIKRLFHNRIDEVVGKIFQNCQRAGARNVDNVTTENTFGRGCVRVIYAIRRADPHEILHFPRQLLLAMHQQLVASF